MTMVKRSESLLSVAINLAHRATFGTSDTTHTLVDVKASIPVQGITAIFGHSGAGKTTLLRCIAGLESRATGSIIFAGEVWQSTREVVPPHQRGIGYVFQEASLFEHLTVAGNLAFAKKRRYRAYEEDYEDQVVAMLDIASLLNKSVTHLSGGERQRVAIARALFSHPRLLLLDEPLSGLDEPRKKDILRCLRDVSLRLQLPMIYVSHHRDEVIELADDMLLLEQGRVVLQDAPTKVFANIKQLQMREAVLVGTADKHLDEWGLVELDCHGDRVWIQATTVHQGEQMKIRILPKDVSLSLSDDKQSSILNRIAVTVTEINVTDTSDAGGTSVLVTLDTGNNTLFAMITRYSMAQLQLTIGMKAWAQVKTVAVLN